MTLNFQHLKMTLLASSIALLCACNSEIDDLAAQNNQQSSEDTEHDHVELTSKGRLAISHTDTANVSIYDTEENQLLEMFNTVNTVSGLFASPGYRYAVAIQRDDNYVEFIDGGLFSEEHDDHLHDYQQAPTLSGFALTDEKPTHFDVSEEQAALFFDGNIDSGIPASFAILTDESIEEGQVLARHTFDNAMHGTAQVRGDSVITTFRSDNTVSVLPNYVEQLHVHGDHYHQEQRFEVDCPSLHGSAQNHEHIAFGCDDGVLVVTQVDESFSALKVANLDSFAEGAQIASIQGSEHSELFLGIAQSTLFYTIDAENNLMSQLDWQQDTNNTILTSTLDAVSGEFYVLESDGMLSVLSAEDGWQVSARFQVAEQPSASYSMTASAADDTLYISDNSNQSVISVDTHEQTSETILTLDFVPNQITWLGIASDSEHEDHDH
ncbi:MAG: hypothetical protein ACTJIB_02760 [Pseudoalteromonas prydzensis]|uniref:hypothetical protein n=1 Tax=Pseudoalteromonas prydzensis TaxID=182141 RepID=UPI003F9C759D